MSMHESSSPGEGSKATGSEHIQPGVTTAGQSETAIQRPPGPRTAQKPAPPPPSRKKPVQRRPMSQGQFAVTLTVMDGIAILCVLILTVFLASFAVRNSDFWSHLAAGQLVEAGVGRAVAAVGGSLGHATPLAVERVEALGSDRQD